MSTTAPSGPSSPPSVRPGGRLDTYLRSQFHRPRGPLGALAGRIMAGRGSGVERNRWLVDGLDLAPDHRVLEIGPGPGVALAHAARTVTDGHLVGVDHSATMLAQAGRRNRAALADGRLTLVHGPIQALDVTLRDFDRIYAMNVWHFWPDQEAVVADLVDRLRPGGMLRLGFQPRHRGATARDVDAARRCLVDQFEAVGLVRLDAAVLDVRPVAVVAVGGRRSSGH